jgi:hypothetical protein
MNDPHRRTKPRSKTSPGMGQLGLAAAAPWKVFECLVSSCWRDTTSLTTILVAKEPPFGGVVTCTFLVDLGCLGPKQAFVSQFRTKRQYETEYRAIMTARHPMIIAPYALVAKIIRESIRYAEDLGLGPAEGVRKSLSALGSLEAANECPETIPVGGRDGKPFYVAGPDDDIDAVMGALMRKCGSDNFTFITPFGPPNSAWS